MVDGGVVVLLAGAGVFVGGVLGGLALVAGRRQGSAEDMLVVAIDAELPQLQCAECGYAGCKPFARAVAKKEATIDLCLPGGEDVIRRLAAIVNETPPPRDTKPSHSDSPRDDNATMQQKLSKQHNATSDNDIEIADDVEIAAVAGMTAAAGVEVAFIRREACVGCALCLPVCPTDAIVGAARFEHSVLEKDCTGCALCLPVCPTDAIVMQAPKKRTALNQTLAGFRASTSSPSSSASAGQQCIRCNYCADVCPAGLSPMHLYASSKDEQWEKMTAEGLTHCIHCQKCDDVCPSSIALSAAFARGKNKAAKITRAKNEATRLKTRYEQRQKRQTPPPPPLINAAAQAKAAQARLQQ